jgi:hypothetical protein
MLNQVIGIFHALFAIAISFYGIIFRKSWFDVLFVLYTLIVLISWTFYNGDCPLTYYIKKDYNQNYVAGEDPTDLQDMYLVFGNKEIVYIIITIAVVFNVISSFIVLKRNGFSSYIYYGIPCFHLLYLISLRTFTNLHKNGIFLFLQNIFKIIFIIYLIIVLQFFYTKKLI